MDKDTFFISCTKLQFLKMAYVFRFVQQRPLDYALLTVKNRNIVRLLDITRMSTASRVDIAP